MFINRLSLALVAIALLMAGAGYAQENIVDGGTNNLGNAAPIGITNPQLDDLRTGTSGANLSNADRNIVIGQRSLIRATTSSDGNVVLGAAAGQNLTSSADSNIFIGEFAGSAGLDPVFGGYSASMTQDQMVVIGQLAGRSLTSATDGVFIGQDAGRSVTTGTDNTFIGAEAGETCATCFDNTVFGEEAGFSLTTGAGDNTFVGEDTGAAIASGDRNTAVGERAFAGFFGGGVQDNDSYNNTAVGSRAGVDTGQGDVLITWNNTYAGAYAGNDNARGWVNTFIGAASGRHTEHADYNTFVGAFAGWDNNRNNGTVEDGERNTYLGAAAGQANRRGNDNVVIGSLADFASWDNVTDAELTTNFDDTFGSLGNDGVEGLNQLGNPPNRSRVVTIGAKARGSRDDGITIGYSADTIRDRAITIGVEAQGTHDDAIAIGYQAASHGEDIAVIGNGTTQSIDAGADSTTALGSPTFRYADAYAKTYHVSADSSASAVIEFVADAGEDNNDSWRIAAADSGDLTIETFANGTYLPAATITNAGDLIVPGEISANSDARLKTNVYNMPEVLPLVAELQPRSFEWKQHLDKRPGTHYGLIAQEVEASAPELVRTGTDDMKSVSYQEVVPLLLGAIQELQASNQAQREAIARLKEEQQQHQDIDAMLLYLEERTAETQKLLKEHNHEED
jgi:hypothetical protein